MEFKALCTLCPWHESRTTEAAAQASAVWHVYDQHHDTWAERMGTSDWLPATTTPEHYGRRLEEWESQA